jgi:glycosyltransferase involved in cell wall biosynthesis
MTSAPSDGPLQVGIDLTGTSAVASGVRTRAEAMIRELAAQPDRVALHLLADDPWAVALGDELGLCVAHAPSTRLRRLLGSGRRVRRFIRSHHLDLVQLEAPPVPRPHGVPVVFSLHDIRYLDQPLSEERSLFGLYQRWGLGRWARRSSCVLALTDTMRDRYVAELRVPPERVLTVPPGRPPAPARGDAPRPTDVPTERYVLCLGHLEQRKNLDVVLAASADPSWPSDVVVIVAGRDEGAGRRLKMAASLLPAGRCRFVGAVSDHQRDTLLGDALVVALPSRIEGFGLVALEANAAGAPVLAAQQSALPEVVGVQASLLRWDDPTQWAGAVGRIATDASWRTELVAAQRQWMDRFSWSRSGELLLDRYDALARRGSR